MEQQILRLDIGMDHMTAVHMLKPCGKLPEQANRLMNAEAIWQLTEATLVGKLIHKADSTIRAMR